MSTFGLYTEQSTLAQPANRRAISRHSVRRFLGWGIGTSVVVGLLRTQPRNRKSIPAEGEAERHSQGLPRTYTALVRRIHFPRTTLHTVASNKFRFSKGGVCQRRKSTRAQSSSASTTTTSFGSRYRIGCITAMMTPPRAALRR